MLNIDFGLDIVSIILFMRKISYANHTLYAYVTDCRHHLHVYIGVPMIILPYLTKVKYS